MSKHRLLGYGVRLPDAWVEPIQEFISTQVSPNFRITKVNPTTIQIAAGTDNDLVAAGISGKWRFITATVQRAHPGGAAGTYDIWLVTTDNSYSGTTPETDSTNYAFDLRIVASGGNPVTGVGATYWGRKVGTLTWDGAAITDIQQAVGGAITSYQTIAAAINFIGTLAARPAAISANAGFTYFATDSNGGTLYESTGTTWQQIGKGLSDPPVAHAASHLPAASDAIAWGTILGSGTLALRPTASTANTNLYYLATDVNSGTLYQQIAGTWTQISAGVIHVSRHLPTQVDALPWTTIIGSGTLGARPASAATNAGYLYLATDTNGGTLYRSTGSAWVQAAASVLSFVSVGTWGTLAAGTVDPVAPTGELMRLAGTAPGTSIRSISASGLIEGTRMTMRPEAVGVTVKHNTAGGSGAIIQLVNGRDVFVAPGESLSFIYTTTYGAPYWVEINADVASDYANSIHLYGTLALRPTAAPQNGGFLYYATDNTTLYRSNGATWDSLTAAPPSNTAISAALLLYGTVGARPTAAAGNAGFYYFANDVAGGTLYQSTGSTWQQIAASIGVAVATVSGSFTFTLAHLGGMVLGSNATAMTATIPPNSSVSYPIGGVLNSAQYGAGQVTVTPGAGVTLRGARLKTAAQYSVWSAIKIGTDEWLVSGDLIL